MHESRCCLGLICTYNADVVLHRPSQDVIRVTKLLLRDPTSSSLTRELPTYDPLLNNGTECNVNPLQLCLG